MDVRLRQWLVMIGVTAAFCHHKIHHLAMMVMMYPYGYHRQKDGPFCYKDTKTFSNLETLQKKICVFSHFFIAM